MGKKDAAKKGKQKVTPAVSVTVVPPPPSPPPPPTIASPLSAHHVQYPSTDHMGVIEELEESGDRLGVPMEGTEESWQDIGHSADGWGDGNNNEDSRDKGWETSIPPSQAPPPASLPPPQKQMVGTAQSYYSQQRPPPSSSNHNVGAHGVAPTGWGHTKPQHPQDIWAPESDGWGEDDASGDGGWAANDDWDDANSGWDQQPQPHSAAWNHAVAAHSTRSRTPSHAPSGGGWQSWSEEARKLPKVTFDPAVPPLSHSPGGKPVLSQSQRSQILDALLNNPQQNQQPYPMAQDAAASFPPHDMNGWKQYQPSHHENQHQNWQPEPHRGHESHKNKRNKVQRQNSLRRVQSQGRQRQEEVHDAWGLGDGWSDLPDEDVQDMPQDQWGRRVHFSPSAIRASMLPSSAPSVVPSAVVENFTINALPQNKLGLSTIPMSKTLSYAYTGTAPSAESEPGRAAMQRITDIQFVESQGEALKGVQRAFYGKQRKAVERFHWLFSPEKDERVSSLLSWINSMSFGIASFGLQKFLQTRERGALVVNAAYRPVHSPSEPAFDWISWNEIQMTMDRILQESVGYYNPATHIIVFVFLPSPSGNSVAMWRRKLTIPSNMRLAYQAQITQAMASLRKVYPIYVDELPASPEPPPPPAPKKKKRKWWRLWLF